MFDDILEKHKLKKEKKKEELEKQLNRITDLKQDKDKQIADLAELVKYTEDDVVQAQIIDTLSTYGKKAISAITVTSDSAIWYVSCILNFIF